MGVVFIGDREVGKTALVTELTNVKREYVNVLNQDYESLKRILCDSSDERFRATTVIDDRFLEIEVRLPIGTRKISVDWVDTPGEIWRKSWQEDNPGEWSQFLDLTTRSDGIILLLPPYREIVGEHRKHLTEATDLDVLITKQQWCNRFERWVEFFSCYCPNARHVAICMNKADLFCNLEQEARKLAYNPHRSPMNWSQRHNYVVASTYFKPLQPQLVQIDKDLSGLSVQCFITSVHNRSLLELPWIYLASYLA
jgi:GTPase SAR1 family protein